MQWRTICFLCESACAQSYYSGFLHKHRGHDFGCVSRGNLQWSRQSFTQLVHSQNIVIYVLLRYFYYVAFHLFVGSSVLFIDQFVKRCFKNCHNLVLSRVHARPQQDVWGRCFQKIMRFSVLNVHISLSKHRGSFAQSIQPKSRIVHLQTLSVTLGCSC